MIAGAAHAHAGNPFLVVALTAATWTVVLAILWLAGRPRRRPRRPQPLPDQPRHVKVLPPQPRDDHGPYDGGAFTIGPDERNQQ
jgi:hypothetical protein